MYYKDDAVFIHPPKTGGSSVTMLLKDVYGSADCHLSQRNKHTTLEQFFYHEWPGHDLNHIVMTIRNPYKRAVSGYFFCRWRWARGYRGEGSDAWWAFNHKFPEWLEKMIEDNDARDILRPYKDFLSVLGRVMPAHIYRLEDLVEQQELIEELISWFGDPGDADLTLPHDMGVDHPPYKNLLNSELNELIEDCHQWTFERGYYDKL